MKSPAKIINLPTAKVMRNFSRVDEGVASLKDYTKRVKQLC